MEVPYHSMDEFASKGQDSGGSNYAYTREEMLRIKDTPPAQERPAFLSIDFNDDKGLFAPDKWFDHTFAHDTHNKTVARTKKILNRGEEELGLSPQRRQFAGGCVPGSNKTEQGTTKVWRNGKAGNREDTKNENNRWKHNKDNDKQHRQRSHASNNEELPEWMESKISVNDVIELKGFDNNHAPAAPSVQKSKEIPLTAPKLDELQLLQEIQRSESSFQSQPTSGSRFITFFNKRHQESQREPSPPMNTDNIRKANGAPQSNNLNDIFGANQAWPEMPASAGFLASDIEKRMQGVTVKEGSPSMLPELVNSIRNPPDVHIKNQRAMNETPKWEDDIIASLMPKHDVFIGKDKQEPKYFEESQHIHLRDDQPDMSAKSSVWGPGYPPSDYHEKIRQDDEDFGEIIHGLNRTPDLSYFAANFPKQERELNISPPHQPPPGHMFADSSIPSRSSPAPPSMLPPFGQMPNHFPNMHMPNGNMPPMSNNGMPMMRFPFPYPFPMMNPSQMAPPNALINGIPHHQSSTSGQSTSSNVTHGGNLPTSVLLRMKSQNPSGQRSRQSPDVLRRENNLSSPFISDIMPQTSHRDGSMTNSDNESNSNGPSSSNMFPGIPNNAEQNAMYNVMMAHQSFLNRAMPPGMPGMHPFPPNMPPFHGMPHIPPHFGPGVHPSFFQGMPPPSDRPSSNSPANFEMKHEHPSIPESILRQLPSSARPLTVADLERNLLSKN